MLCLFSLSLSSLFLLVGQLFQPLLFLMKLLGLLKSFVLLPAPHVLELLELNLLLVFQLVLCFLFLQLHKLNSLLFKQLSLLLIFAKAIHVLCSVFLLYDGTLLLPDLFN